MDALHDIKHDFTRGLIITQNWLILVIRIYDVFGNYKCNLIAIFSDRYSRAQTGNLSDELDMFVCSTCKFALVQFYFIGLYVRRIHSVCMCMCIYVYIF